MTSDTLSAPADACSPDADRAGPAMPENIARLLYIVRTLLQFGRHLAATIERRATGRGFWLFSAVFGTAELPVMRAYLHRGILRAATLESLLLRRAATGRDVAAPRTGQTAWTEDAKIHPCDEPFRDQLARLTAERAQHDAPVEPDHSASVAQIEAEVRARPIGRSIADICRDLGVVAMMCTRAFRETIVNAIACYHDCAAAECLDDAQQDPQASRPHENEPEPERMGRRTGRCRGAAVRRPWLKIDKGSSRWVASHSPAPACTTENPHPAVRSLPRQACPAQAAPQRSVTPPTCCGGVRRHRPAVARGDEARLTSAKIPDRAIRA
jgi:hypothetical protein